MTKPKRWWLTFGSADWMHFQALPRRVAHRRYREVIAGDGSGEHPSPVTEVVLTSPDHRQRWEWRDGREVASGWVAPVVVTRTATDGGFSTSYCLMSFEDHARYVFESALFGEWEPSPASDED